MRASRENAHTPACYGTGTVFSARSAGGARNGVFCWWSPIFWPVGGEAQQLGTVAPSHERMGAAYVTAPPTSGDPGVDSDHCVSGAFRSQLAVGLLHETRYRLGLLKQLRPASVCRKSIDLPTVTLGAVKDPQRGECLLAGIVPAVAPAVIRGSGSPSGLITGVYAVSDRGERPPVCCRVPASPS